MKQLLTFVAIILLALSQTICAADRIIEWSALPTYKAIKPYSETLFLCQSDKGWGLMDYTGRILLPAEYDFVTTPSSVDSYGLYGLQQGSKYLIKGFVRADGSLSALSKPFYAVPPYLEFREGKICVANASDRKGFIDIGGKEVIKCQFDEVHPFSEGLASVKQGAWAFYIGENYDSNPSQNVVYSEWRDGEVTMATTFSKGEAVVGYGADYFIINKSGRKLRPYRGGPLKLNVADYTLSTGSNPQPQSLIAPFTSTVQVYSEDGKYGLKEGESCIVKPVFTSVSPVDKNDVTIVSVNSRYGLIHLIPNNLITSLTKDGANVQLVQVNPQGQSEQLQYTIQIPANYVGHVKVLFDDGSGSYQDVTSFMTKQSNTMSYAFSPQVQKSDTLGTMRSRIEYEGIEVYNDMQTYAIKHPLVLRVTAPIVATAVADVKTDRQQVIATVYNDSPWEVEVVATLTVECPQCSPHVVTLNLSGNSSQSVTQSVYVSKDQDVKATCSLSTGQSSTSIVSLRVY